MDNQHKMIKGYRDLSQQEIDLINRLKEYAQEIGDAIEDAQTMEHIDQRWLAIGKTDLQKGFMSLVRAIARPESF